MAFFAVKGAVNDIIRITESFSKLTVKILIIFNNQNSHQQTFSAFRNDSTKSCQLNRQHLFLQQIVKMGKQTG
jgi:hypothetical protein